MATRTIVKQVANGILYSDGTIRADNVRLSFPHLDEPYAGTNDEGKPGAAKYGVVLMLPKTSHKELKNLIKGEIEKLCKTNDTLVATDKWCLRDGAQSDKEEYQDCFTVSLRESRRPSVRNKRGDVLTPDEVAEMFYGGCWGNVLLRIWYQDGKKVGKGYGKRINGGLVGVQFVRDDEPFGEGRVTDEGAFDPVDGDGGSDNSGMDDDDEL